MPSLAFAGGKLMLVYYDLRETRAQVSGGEQVFGKFISDQNLTRRQTIDIRAAMGTPGAVPTFGPSVQVSDYLVGNRRPAGSGTKQLQFNPPNLPMFKQGTVPFIGDYIDVAAAPAFVPNWQRRLGLQHCRDGGVPGLPRGVDRQSRRACAPRWQLAELHAARARLVAAGKRLRPDADRTSLPGRQRRLA